MIYSPARATVFTVFYKLECLFATVPKTPRGGLLGGIPPLSWLWVGGLSVAVELVGGAQLVAHYA